MSDSPGDLIGALIEQCPQDGIHCNHWWDDEGPCCGCGDDTDAGLSDADREPPERDD